MTRKRVHAPLQVYLNNRLVGYLTKESSGAVAFAYDRLWLEQTQAVPVSLALPLMDRVYRGAPVVAVFENLLPDSDELRRRVAEKVGAAGLDAYSLLAAIGHDCVGALQFVVEDVEPKPNFGEIQGEVLDEAAMERLLNSLALSPLGLSRDDEFRISVAGAQEKTALLRHNGQWMKPHGTTPTTHLFKTQIGQLPNGVDLSNSVENEFYCLKLLEAFGLPVNQAEVHTFGNTRVLVIERFDRRWTQDGRLLRLPQEDCCQALGVPPTQKYQSDRGPGMVDILNLLKGSNKPQHDQALFLKAQIVFWLMGATDGHAKNFSIFLGKGGRYVLTPFYDVLSVQPSLDARQLERKRMKMAMSVGHNKHYRVDGIHARHFVQTAEKAGVSETLVRQMLDEIASNLVGAFERVEGMLPSDFSQSLHESVKAGVMGRVSGLRLG